MYPQERKVSSRRDGFRHMLRVGEKVNAVAGAGDAR